ncbi:MAG: hypothetical protein HRT69_05395, partial [Flavobacteriaceae bacterium]|nr:hypothetical protein [Flavobacteriaceae bacterium]
MKIKLLLLALLVFGIHQAQNVSIPDPVFKQWLLNHNPVIDTNDDNEIQVIEAEAYTGDFYRYNYDIQNYGSCVQDCFNNYLGPDQGLELGNCLDMCDSFNLQYDRIYDLTGIGAFKNVTSIKFFDLNLKNQTNDIVINNFNNLVYLELSFASMESQYVTNNITIDKIDLSNNPALISVKLSRTNASGVQDQTGIVTLKTDNSPLLDIISTWNLSSLKNLDISTNVNLRILFCSGTGLETLVMNNNYNLEKLKIRGNNLTSLNLTNYNNLLGLDCSNNNITSLDVIGCTSLIQLSCASNQLSSLDISNSENLDYINCAGNSFTTLDFSSNIELKKINIAYNPVLSYLNLKNGGNDNITESNYNNYILVTSGGAQNNFSNLPVLENICVDDISSEAVDIINNTLASSVTFTKYCTLYPKRNNEINGTVTLDIDENGCDIADLLVPNVKVVATNGAQSFATYSDEQGNYKLYTNSYGTYTTEATSNVPNYYDATPSSYEINFIGYNNIETANFCLKKNQNIDDVTVAIIPMSQARPGFDARYQIVYKNIGTTTKSGSIEFSFEDGKTTFLSATETIINQTNDSVGFDYLNLSPFETRTINLNFNVLPPPTVNIGDVLNFIATINPISGDQTPYNNVFNLKQSLIGSYDPNNIK